MLAAPMLPVPVRAKILEYVEEKAAGYYGDSEKLRRKFVVRLLAKRLEQTRQVEAQIVKIAAKLGRGKLNGVPAASASYARPRRVARRSGRPHIGRKLPNPSKAL
jgi:hypothetical protein